MKRFLLASLVLLATEAAAHADLVSSIPADGSELAAPPDRIELRFNEPVRAMELRLLDASGQPVRLAPPQGEGLVLRILLSDKLAAGQYTLSYRVASLDSHPVSGAIVFGIGVSAPIRGARPAQERGLFHVLVRAMRDLALLVAAGGALFSLWMRGFPGDAALVRWCALAGAAACVIAIGLQDTGMQSSLGISAGAAIMGLLGIASLRPVLMIPGAFAALGSLALTGHALLADPRWIGMISLAAHALAAAFWVGSLAGLYFILVRQPLRAAAALRRFSPVGMAGVGLLLAAGVVLGVLHLHAPSDLVMSEYGRFIAAKAVLLALLILLALMNRYRFLPSLERGAAKAGLQLRRSIGLELALLTGVVTVTAFLVQTPPPDRPHEQTLVNGPHKATLSVAPARAGRNVISIRLEGAQEISIEIANTDARLGPITRPMRRISSADYRHEGAELAFRGTWDLTIHARVSDFENVAFPATVTIH